MKQFNKLAVRILSIVSVFVIIALNVVPVFAAPNETFPSSAIQPQNWTEEDRVGTVVDGYEWYNVDPWSQGYYARVRERNMYQGSSTYSSVKSVGDFTYQIGPMHVPSQGSQIYWRYDFDFQYFYNGRFLDLSGINNNCKFYFEINLEWLVATGTVIDYNDPDVSYVQINYYDSSGKYISTQSEGFQYSRGWDADNTGYYVISEGNFILPDSARYCTVSLEFYDFGITANEFCTFSFNFTDVQFLIGKPERLLIQNYQYIGTLVSSNKFTKNWRIDNSPNIGSAYMTSTDPNLPSMGGLNYNLFKYTARPSSSYQYNMRFRLFYPNRYLTLDNLPKGTTVGVVAKFHIYSNATWYYPACQIMISYFDDNFQQIDSSQHYYFERTYERIDDNTGGYLSANFTLDYPDNAKYLTVNVYLNNFYIYGSSSQEVTCICDQLEFWVGEKVDTPDFPTGDNLGDLSNSLDVDKPSIEDFFHIFNSSLDKGFLLKVANAFAIFWEIDFLVNLLLILFAFSLLAVIFFGGH